MTDQNKMLRDALELGLELARQHAGYFAGHAMRRVATDDGVRTMEDALAALDDNDAAARAKGRAEAMQLLMVLCPETGIEDITGWSRSSAPEDEGSAYWDEDKLRELLHVDSALADMLDNAECEYYRNIGLRDEAERINAIAQLQADKIKNAVICGIVEGIKVDGTDPGQIAESVVVRLLMSVDRESYAARGAAQHSIAGADAGGLSSCACCGAPEGEWMVRPPIVMAERLSTLKPDCYFVRDADGSREYNTIDEFSGGRSNGVELYTAAQVQAIMDERRAAMGAGSLIVPDGWQLVPKVSTQAMSDAGRAALASGPTPMEKLYRAMLAAAPRRATASGAAFEVQS